LKIGKTIKRMNAKEFLEMVEKARKRGFEKIRLENHYGTS